LASHSGHFTLEENGYWLRSRVNPRNSLDMMAERKLVDCAWNPTPMKQLKRKHVVLTFKHEMEAH
jgi:hypothetical protein